MTDTFIAYVATPSGSTMWVYKVHRATGYERLHQDGYTFGVSILRDDGVAWFVSNSSIVVTRAWDEAAPNQVLVDMP